MCTFVVSWAYNGVADWQVNLICYTVLYFQYLYVGYMKICGKKCVAAMGEN